MSDEITNNEEINLENYDYENLIENVSIQELSRFYSIILSEIENKKKNILTPIEYTGEREPVYNVYGDTYIKIEGLIKELPEINKEHYKDSVIEIENLLLNLIGKLFPKKTDSLFTVELINYTRNNSMNVALRVKQETVSDYIQYLKDKAKTIGQNHLQQESFGENVSSATPHSISDEAEKIKETHFGVGDDLSGLGKLEGVDKLAKSIKKLNNPLGMGNSFKPIQIDLGLGSKFAELQMGQLAKSIRDLNKPSWLGDLSEHMHEELLGYNVPSATPRDIHNEIDVIKNTQSEMKSKLDTLDTESIQNITNEARDSLENVKKLEEETKEKSEKITTDYENFAKQYFIKDFNEKSTKLEEECKCYFWCYVAMIGANIAIVVGINLRVVPQIIENPSIVERLGVGFLVTTPILIMLLWLTRYFNRRVHELIHLKEEYEHKYITMLVFDTFKEKVEVYGKKAEYEYLMKVIDTITKNPTGCLTKQKADNIPTNEIAELIKAIQPFATQQGKQDGE